VETHESRTNKTLDQNGFILPLSILIQQIPQAQHKHKGNKLVWCGVVNAERFREVQQSFDHHHKKRILDPKTHIALYTHINLEQYKTTMSSMMLMLFSGQSPSREVMSNQEKALTILRAKSIPYETLDGALPESRDRRNELFAISGIRAKYPQFFITTIVGATTTTLFWGDWEKFEYANEEGTLVHDFNASAGKATAAAQESTSSSSSTDAAAVASTVVAAENNNAVDAQESPVESNKEVVELDETSPTTTTTTL
jgi:SH3-binding, glutamic acid-rich protein